MAAGVKHNSDRAALALAALILFGSRVWAQSAVPTDAAQPTDAAERGEAAGQGELAFQGYYLAQSGQPLLQTSGAALNFQEFVPGFGLIDGNVEGYGSDGFPAGTNFLALEQVPLWGWHWDFVGGDFRFSSNVVENPFLNIYTPEIAGRGVGIAVKRKDRAYQFFAGVETVLVGPRIPFLVTLPQNMVGATLQQKLGKRWEFGLRYVHLTTESSALTSYSNYFLPSRQFQNSNSLTLQSSYSFTTHLKLYSEVTYGTASTFTPSPGAQQPFSLLVGPSWQKTKFGIHANYIRQSTTYLPLLGYFVGDRKGPYVEGYYRPAGWVNIYGSASAYSNNLEHNPDVPTFHSSGYTAGANFVLPWKFNAGASLASLNLTERDPSRSGPFVSDNRQLNINLGRPIGRHNLRFSLIDMKLNSNLLPQTQRFGELEDTFIWKRLVLGGAVRLQNSHTTENRNTLFYRGSIQANLKRVSAYGYWEEGSDLVNRSVFSTNAYSSTVVGLSTPLIKGWSLQLEAFRNNLNTALNPENIFLFGNSGLGLNTALAAFNQRSAYFRISKQFHWGKEMPGFGRSLEQYTAEHAPLVGSVQGFVIEQSLAGPRPAANVTVSLDHYRAAVTDASGRYEFVHVAEGPHEVGLDQEQLPTDYEPGPAPTAIVSVQPQAIARADFTVVRLAYLRGRIVAPVDAPLDGVVIRLAGTNRYTTPDLSGNFAFYNLREGEYDVVIDVDTLPDGYLLASSPSIRSLASSSASPAAPIRFELRLKPQPNKPIRQLFEEHIHVGTGGR